MKKLLLAIIALKAFELSAQNPNVCLSPSLGSPFLTGANTSPKGVVVADFNSDGKPDLATVNGNSANVSILTGNGTGGFSAPVSFSVNSGPWSMASGDFNNDGKIDLVTSHYGSSDAVSVILGNGAGAFSAAATFTTGSSPQSVAVGDFNNDGNKDLVTANSNGMDISLLLGAGNGSFGSAASFTTGGMTPQAIACSDFNNDGKMDVVATNRMSNNITVLMGNGAGSFTTTTIYAANAMFPCSIAIEDFNSDGKMDIVTCNNDFNNTKNFSLFLNNGSGVFGPGTIFSAGPNGNYLCIASGDINGDAIADIALMNNNEVDILPGTGTGNFGAAMSYTFSGQNTFVTMKDLNMDGRADIAVSEQNDDVIVLLNRSAIISTSGPTTFCSGGKVTLRATKGGTSYLWNPAGGVADSTVVTTSGIYSVTITSGICSSTSNSIAVIVNPLPSVAIAGANSICAGQSTTLTASGAASYSWLPVLSSGATIVAGPTSTTTYTVIGASAAGCTNTATKTLTVNALPTVSVSGANAICFGNSTNLIASGAASYTWNTGPTSATIIISPTVTTNYSVTGTGTNGCINTTNKTVTVNPLPTVNAVSSSSLLCSGQSATLSASGTSVTYNWNPGGPGISIVISPTATTNYSVTGTDGNGCVKTTVITQSVSACAGISENHNSTTQVLLYPNPNNGSFTIKTHKESLVILVDGLGKIIEKISLTSTNDFTYTISGLSPGVYFITDSQGGTAQKLVCLD